MALFFLDACIMCWLSFVCKTNLLALQLGCCVNLVRRRKELKTLFYGLLVEASSLNDFFENELLTASEKN